MAYASFGPLAHTAETTSLTPGGAAGTVHAVPSQWRITPSSCAEEPTAHTSCGPLPPTPIRLFTIADGGRVDALQVLPSQCSATAVGPLYTPPTAHASFGPLTH